MQSSIQFWSGLVSARLLSFAFTWATTTETEHNTTEVVKTFLKQGSYTTGPSKFQDFSRTFKDHIYKNPGPVIARKTETIQTNQQTM